MRIIYIANHSEHDNNDEIAIAWALEQLGHKVTRIQEWDAYRYLNTAGVAGQDFLLFHKWTDIQSLRNVSRQLPCVCWFFDLLESNDPTLAPRSAHRVQWLHSVSPLCKVVFLTDGDFVARYGKNLVHLMQGADERVMGKGVARYPDTPPILFMGMVNHGQKRASHIAELQNRYGSKFGVIGNGGPATRKHGRDLADLIASAKIIVAPDGPGTDRYTSNRVYLVTGFGGFLIHPYCEMLTKQYQRGDEICFYRDRAECTWLIDAFLEDDENRKAIAEAGYQRTLREHTYRHRCEQLIQIVQERL